MLKGLDPLLTPDLLWVLRAMGHGDEIVLCDTNFPSHSVAGSKRVIALPGLDACRIARAILSVMPLDKYVDAPAMYMAAPEQQPIHTMMQDVVSALNDFPVTLDPVERFAFYERAKQGFGSHCHRRDASVRKLHFQKGVVRPTARANVCRTSSNAAEAPASIHGYHSGVGS